MNNKENKILIIRLSSIGDVLLATPFIRQVKNKFPNARIDFLIRKEFEDLIKYNPNIDSLFSYDTKTGKKGLSALRKQLNKNNYTHIFDLHNNFRSVYIRKGIQCSFKSIIVKDKFIQSLLVWFKLNRYKQKISIPDRYLNVGKPFGVEDKGEGLELFWNDDIDKSIDNILKDKNVRNNEVYYTVAPGAGFYTKRWPIGYFKRLIKELSDKHEKKIIVLGSENEKENNKQLNDITGIINLTGKLSLLQSAAIIKRSLGLISNDSGLMHAASAVKTPVLAIFGSTVEEFGFFPYRCKSIIVENKNIDCRPCSHIGRKTCPKKHFKCMKELKPEIVFNNFEKLINE